MISGLIASAIRLCDGALAELGPGDVRAGVERVRQRLGEPLRIAIAGRVGTGKSTLVNALLGLRVAPTAAGECTRVVTWFRYGDRDAAELRMRDGSIRPLALSSDRSLPERLGVEVDDVESIQVSLYAETLERMTLIDTPGLASLSEGGSDRTSRLLALDSSEAVSRADALVYVMTRDVREDDERALSGFRSHAGRLRASAGNAVAVLNKADKLADDEDGMREAAHRLAERWADDLGSTVGAVIPVVGLLAETVEAGRLDEDRAQELRRLAALPPEERRRLLASVRRFLGGEPAVVGSARRSELLARLDLFGIRACLDSIDRGRGGAIQLAADLRRLSGIAELQEALRTTFARRADVLKADAALEALRQLAAHAGDRREGELLAARLRTETERLALLPEMQRVREMDVLSEAAAGDLALPQELRDDLRRIATGREVAERLGVSPTATADEVRQVALRRAAQWRAFGNDGRRTPAEARAARVLGISYAALIREADGAMAVAA